MEPAFSLQPSHIFRRWVRQLSQQPILFDCLRWGLEGGFHEHKQLLKRHFHQRDLRILDCGCGTGIYAKHFSPKGYVGIDVSVAYLDRAKRLNPDYRFECMDAMDLRFEDGSFDAVFVSGVVHHMSNDDVKKVFAEIHRVLHRSGVLLLWEDVPTRSRFNVVGSLVHRFDMGAFIRPAPEYASLLEDRFTTESTEEFQSGFMDYSVFRCRPLPVSKEHVEPQQVEPQYLEQQCLGVGERD